MICDLIYYNNFSALEETVEDYEAIRTLDEEILETQKEAERELKNEFDRANGRISDVCCSAYLSSGFYAGLLEKQADDGMSFKHARYPSTNLSLK